MLSKYPFRILTTTEGCVLSLMAAKSTRSANRAVTSFSIPMPVVAVTVTYLYSQAVVNPALNPTTS